MSEWKKEIIGKHIDLISGYAFKSKDFLENQEENTLPIIKIKNVANGDVNLNKVVYHKFDDALSKFLLSKGDILIAMTGNHPQAKTQVVGDVSKYKLQENALLNQRVGKFVAKGETDLNFIYYFFKDKDTQRYLANQSSGSANQANISKTNILNLEVEIPEPIEQKLIAEILTSLDNKIDLLHSQNKTLDAIAETLLRQWFESYDGVEHVIYKLEELVKHIKPGTNYQPKRIDKGIPFLNVRNLSNGFIDNSQFKYISEEEYLRVHKNWKPEENDILISRIGTLGLVAIIKEDDLPIAVHYNMLNLKASKIGFSFLYFLLKSDYFQIEYNKIKRASVQEYVAVDDVKNINIPLPVNNQLEYYENTFYSLLKKIISNSNQIYTLKKLRDNLLPKLMSGEIKVVENE